MLRIELLYNTKFLLCICHENLQSYTNFHMNIHVNIIHDLLKVTTAQIPSFLEWLSKLQHIPKVEILLEE